MTFKKKLAIVFDCCYDGDLPESLGLKASQVETKSKNVKKMLDDERLECYNNPIKTRQSKRLEPWEERGKAYPPTCSKTFVKG